MKCPCKGVKSSWSFYSKQLIRTLEISKKKNKKRKEKRKSTYLFWMVNQWFHLIFSCHCNTHNAIMGTHFKSILINLLYHWGNQRLESYYLTKVKRLSRAIIGLKSRCLGPYLTCSLICTLADSLCECKVPCNVILFSQNYAFLFVLKAWNPWRACGLS